MNAKLSWIGWMPIGSLGAAVTAVYVAWFAAMSQLGRSPVPSMDDPKFIGGFATAVYHVMSWIVLLAVATWIVGMLATSIVSLLPRTEGRRGWIVKCAFGAMAIPLLFLIVRYSPGDACNWFLD
jgi:hypothetical protein